jgi:signal transduction histidine kinase
LVTGLRNRFFVIILAALVLAAISINLVHVSFFKSQRLKLIDHLISESSGILLGAPEFGSALGSPQMLEEQISKILGGKRIGKIFVLQDAAGKILYQSENLNVMQVSLPTSPEWVTLETGDQFLRVRNIPSKLQGGSIFQVGLVLDRNFINWEILDARVVRYVAGIIVALFAASVFLTLLLLSPLRILISHLSRTTVELENLKDVAPLPGFLTKYTAGFLARSDEFSNLIEAIQKLIDRINLNYKLTRSWTLQMAHELKTPLAVVRAITEANFKAGKLPEHFAADVSAEVTRMSNIMDDFLNWAELENSRPQKDLHSIKAGKTIRAIAGRIENLEPNRMHLEIQTEFSVFANPGHFDQLVSNLITNALKYSPAGSPVIITVANRHIKVIDGGPGIPGDVLERLGEPFNFGHIDGKPTTGNGLGLAWVATVAKLYGWKFHLDSSQRGTQAIVQFPDQVPNENK